ncbi:hypothetical protein HYPSUDRAFT_209244 [Hypholoma sublateritium FD-334 SS-4]|uniref:F-box domain-containing protein n=1 Tax=Hypholoma sublateritium (strain FD-334 SS-4) TaxID=945553 RepID=A0A0D2LSJ9_HYPSF|nr:hypothetical protein HYPSUDRAFT_209244 [Hypholoma sublateritium FD-334 SS-4]
METPAKLPLDVLGYITEMVAADNGLRKTNRRTIHTLKMLCLTCKLMVPVCRRHLFARISFPFFPKVPRRRDKLNEFILSNSTIAHYVKILRLNVMHPFITWDYDFLQKICDSSSATSVEIASADSRDWDAVPEKTKAVVLFLVQMPTVRYITLRAVKNFPASALSRTSKIRQLVFCGFCSLSPPGGNSTVEDLTITTLNGSLELWPSSYDGSDNTLASLMSPIGQNTIEGAVSFIAFNRLKSITLSITTPCISENMQNPVEFPLDIIGYIADLMGADVIPTLRYLTLNRIDNFPAAVLSRCSGLSELILYGISSVVPLGPNDAMQANTLKNLVSLTSHSASDSNNTLAVLMSPIGPKAAGATGSVIALDRLTHVSLGVISQAEFPQLLKFLEKAICLERLELDVVHMFTRLAGLGSTLAAHPNPKLRSVTVKFSGYIQRRDRNTLPDLNLELRHLSGKNVIEVLEVKACGEPDVLWTPEANDWAADFDELMTDSNAFPALRQVGLSLECRADEKREEDRWKMTEAWFPRILENKATHFKFCR